MIGSFTAPLNMIGSKVGEKLFLGEEGKQKIIQVASGGMETGFYGHMDVESARKFGARSPKSKGATGSSRVTGGFSGSTKFSGKTGGYKTRHGRKR